MAIRARRHARKIASRLGVCNFKEISYNQFLSAGMWLPGQLAGGRDTERDGRVMYGLLVLPALLAAGTLPAAALDYACGRRTAAGWWRRPSGAERMPRGIREPPPPPQAGPGRGAPPRVDGRVPVVRGGRLVRN